MPCLEVLTNSHLLLGLHGGMTGNTFQMDDVSHLEIQLAQQQKTDSSR